MGGEGCGSLGVDGCLVVITPPPPGPFVVKPPARDIGPYISVHVLLNLLNKLRKRDKMQGMPSILSLFRNLFSKLKCIDQVEKEIKCEAYRAFFRRCFFYAPKTYVFTGSC